MVQFGRRAATSCPSCGGVFVRRSASAARHLLRSFSRSRKRYCLTCGYKWSAAGRRERTHPLSWRELGSAAAAIAAAALIVAAAGSSLFFGWTAADARNAYALAMFEPFLPGHQSFAPGELSDRYRFPVPASGWPKVSSRFGYRFHPILHRGEFHRGLDLPMPWGTPVYPSRAGKVTEAGWLKGYGLRIVILHRDGESTLYGHLSRILAKIGDEVESGTTLIGRVGSTGLATGPHLHFEVRSRHGRAIDPDAVLAP